MLEKDFQAAVVELARLKGWLVHHTRTVKIQNGGWTSPGIVNGFPDLVLVHEQKQKIIFAELKSEKGKVSADQTKWLNALDSCRATAVVWRPDDWDYISRVL